MRKTARLVFVTSLLTIMVGCGSQSTVTTNPTINPTPAAATVPVSLSVTDTPPAGVTVLFFQLSITGASLANRGTFHF